ncbi:hypothetical protein BKA63DRAFT_607225 [Paraphoma chrysanthemicola]|nr:hypothetical protein BKA63DRAFT_607225 [Paraphoma chrysanthemicola]
MNLEAGSLETLVDMSSSSDGSSASSTYSNAPSEPTSPVAQVYSSHDSAINALSDSLKADLHVSGYESTHTIHSSIPAPAPSCLRPSTRPAFQNATETAEYPFCASPAPVRFGAPMTTSTEPEKPSLLLEPASFNFAAPMSIPTRPRNPLAFGAAPNSWHQKEDVQKGSLLSDYGSGSYVSKRRPFGFGATTKSIDSESRFTFDSPEPLRSQAPDAPAQAPASTFGSDVEVQRDALPRRCEASILSTPEKVAAKSQPETKTPNPYAATVEDDFTDDEPSFVPKRQAGHSPVMDEAGKDEGSRAKRQFNKSAPPMFTTATERSIAETSGSNLPKYAENPPSQESLDAAADKKSLDAFITCATSILALEPFDMFQLSPSFRSLHNSLVAYGNNLINNTTTQIEHQASISNLNNETRRLEPSSSLSSQSNIHRKVAERRSLVATRRSVQDAAEKSRQDLMKAFFNELKTICKQREKAGKANANNKHLLQNLQLKQINEDAATTLQEARDSAHEKQMQQKSEHKEALRMQAERFRTQIDDANAKNCLHKATLIKLENTEMKIRTVENEKAHLALAKAAVEKELHDLINQAYQWKSFADGYKQIKDERDVLLGQLNDAVAERDELRKKDPTHNASEAQAASKVSLNASIHSVETIRVDDRHLEGVKVYWQKQLDLAEIPGRNMEAELAKMEEDIAEIEDIFTEEQMKKEAASEPAAIGSADGPSEQDSFLPIIDAAESNKLSEDNVADDAISLSASPRDIDPTFTAHPNQITAPTSSWQETNFQQRDVDRDPLSKLNNATNSRQQHPRVVSEGAPPGNPVARQRSASAIGPHQAWPTLRQAHGLPPGAAQHLVSSQAQPHRQTFVQSIEVMQNSVGQDESWSSAGQKERLGGKERSRTDISISK